MPAYPESVPLLRGFYFANAVNFVYVEVLVPTANNPEVGEMRKNSTGIPYLSEYNTMVREFTFNHTHK